MQCDDQPLELLLDADDGSCNHPKVAQHVNACGHCQERLVQLAASAEDWNETRHWLRQDRMSREAFEGSTEDCPDDADEFTWQRGQRWRSGQWTKTMAKSLLSAPSHPEMLGRIGRYDVERLIGNGGMGVVFKAYDTELNRPVAVKLLTPSLAGNGSARQRFAREARAAAAVVDDHVVAIHNVESGDDSEQPPFLVMQYIGGGSLQERLDRDGPLDVCEILRIGMQAARGLAAAHTQGLIHRDVKPSNILLDEGVERALLTDFGLARAEDDACLTRSGFHPGTPHYMSPEQVRGEAIDARSDLFGLGCVLYAMCTGHPPFRSETSYAVLRRITDDTPRSMRESNPSIPTWLEDIVMKLLAKTADQRFASAEQVAVMFEECLAHCHQPSVTPLPESLVALSSGRSRTPPHYRFAAAAAFAFSLIFAGVLIVLELDKGTLTIESNVDDVAIRIMNDGETVERLTVRQAGETVRIAAGNYVVMIDEPTNELTVKDGQVSLRRGGNEIVKIVQSAAQPITSKMPTNKVEFVLGSSQFESVDQIVIESVSSSGNGFEIGATVTVQGHYTLESFDSATLAFYSTVTRKRGETPVGTPVQPSQRMQAKKGTHAFTLSKEITTTGSPHISFYHPKNGQRIGGAYFAAVTLQNTDPIAMKNTPPKHQSAIGAAGPKRTAGIPDSDTESLRALIEKFERLIRDGKYRNTLD